MKTLILLISLIFLPHEEYQFIVELVKKLERYAREEHQKKALIRFEDIEGDCFKIVTIDGFPADECRVTNETRTKDYIIVNNKIRYVATSTYDTCDGICTWTKSELLFSRTGKGVEFIQTMELLACPPTKTDTLRLNELYLDKVRKEYRKSHFRKVSNELKWLTEKVKQLHTAKPKAN